MEDTGTWDTLSSCGCERKYSMREEAKDDESGSAKSEGGGGGGGCGEDCEGPRRASAVESTESAFQSVSQALENIQAVIGNLDAKVEGTRQAINGIKHSIRDKKRRVEGLQKRMDDVEKKLTFNDTFKDLFRPLAGYMPHSPLFNSVPIPPPTFSSISTSTSDLPSSFSNGSNSTSHRSSRFYLGSFSSASSLYAKHSPLAPISIAISTPNSVSSDVSVAFSKSKHDDLRDSTVILRFIPVSNSNSNHSARSDVNDVSNHRHTALPASNSVHVITPPHGNRSNPDSIPLNEIKSAEKIYSDHDIRMTSTVKSLLQSVHSSHSVLKSHSVHSPVSGPESNSNYFTSTVTKFNSIHVSLSGHKFKSEHNSPSVRHSKPINKRMSVPNTNRSLSCTIIAASEECRDNVTHTVHKSNSVPMRNAHVNPAFISTPNLKASSKKSNVTLGPKITPTHIPVCFSKSAPSSIRFSSSLSRFLFGSDAAPPPPPPPPFASASFSLGSVRSSVGLSLTATSSSSTTLVNYTSSFGSCVTVPSGCRSLLVQTVSSTVRPLTVHSSRMCSDHALHGASSSSSSSSSSSPVVCKGVNERPPSTCESGDETDSMYAIKYIALPHFHRSFAVQTDEAATGAVGATDGGDVEALASVPTVIEADPVRQLLRVCRSTPIQTESLVRKPPVAAAAAKPVSVGVCTSKALVSVHVGTSNPSAVAASTSTSNASAFRMKPSSKFFPLLPANVHVLTGTTLTLLGKELLKAAYEGRAADVELILRAGVDVNYTCGSTWTPLHRASWGGHATVVAVLLRRGADVRAVTAFGFTALHIAAYNDPSGACVSLLIDAGAELDARNRLGWTPLHYASEGGRDAAVRALVRAGANASVRSCRGKTPYHVARTRGIRETLLTGHYESRIDEEEDELDVS